MQPGLAPKREVGLKGEDEHDEHEGAVDDTHFGGDTALKFLLAGGVAGAGTSRFFLNFFVQPALPRLTTAKKKNSVTNGDCAI